MASTFQLDETGDDPEEFRVVKQDSRGNVCGDFMFREVEIDGVCHVVIDVRRFDEAEFGSVQVNLP
jgi:hypothetical protein